jgi:hypothetical protein
MRDPSTIRGVDAFALALAMFHVSALITGHVLGNKTSGMGPLIVTLTVLSFPVTFLTTDLLNEHRGRAVTRRVSALAVVCAALAVATIEIARVLPAAGDSHLPPGAFDHVLAVPAVQAGGLVAGYGLGQAADIAVFHRMREWTRGRALWARVLGSTVAVDAGVMSLFLLPPSVLGDSTPAQSVDLALTWSQMAIRMGITVALLPAVYASHRLFRQRWRER